MQWLPSRWYFSRCVAQPNIYLFIYKEVNLYNYYFERERDREKVSIMLQNSGVLLWAKIPALLLPCSCVNEKLLNL